MRVTEPTCGVMRSAMYIAVAALLGIVMIVDWGVVKRYVYNDAQPYVEQVALILVITVAMFGASAGVRDEGHIGMESLVGLLPEQYKFWVGVTVGLLTIYDMCKSVDRAMTIECVRLEEKSGGKSGKFTRD